MDFHDGQLLLLYTNSNSIKLRACNYTSMEMSDAKSTY